MYSHVADTGQDFWSSTAAAQGTSDTQRTVRCENKINRKENHLT